MKHAAVLYTCVGLMGAAAIAGFVDYSDAKSSGVMARLYQEEEKTRSSDPKVKKEIELEDYSRKAFETFDPPKEVELSDVPEKKEISEEFIPPPPPPAPDAPPAPEVKDEDIPPPPPPKAEEPPLPVTEPVSPLEEVKAIPAIPVVAPEPIIEEKEVSFKSFSRAPIKKKKVSVATKRKE